MLERFRRKSLVITYENVEHGIFLKDANVICGAGVAINLHCLRFKKLMDLGKKKGKKQSDKVEFARTGNPAMKSYVRKHSVDRTVFNMILCPSGIFKMRGYPAPAPAQGCGDLGYGANGINAPIEKKIEKSFWLGQTEVTQALFEAVMGAEKNPSKITYKHLRSSSLEHPVEAITLELCVEFCNKLSVIHGFEPCYTSSDSEKYVCDFTKNGYRLPTEEEWEYAAKAGTNNSWAGTDDIRKLGLYAVYSVKRVKHKTSKTTQRVGTKLPNEWGFYDMSGNVWELCWGKFDPNNSQTEKRNAYIFRGGHFGTDSLNNRVDVRVHFGVYQKSLACNGFRIARTLV